MNEIDETVQFAKFESTLVATVVETRLREADVVQRLKSLILDELKDGSIQNVVLDLAAVEFVGSIAFLAFLAIRRYPTVDRILLCNLQENVREVFVLCRLIAGGNNPAAPFSEVESVAEALKQLGG